MADTSRAYARPYSDRAYGRAYDSGDNGHHATGNRTRQRYFFTWGIKQGKDIVLGKFGTKAKAESEGMKANFDVPFEVFNLPANTPQEALPLINRLRSESGMSRYTRYQGNRL